MNRSKSCSCQTREHSADLTSFVHSKQVELAEADPHGVLTAAAEEVDGNRIALNTAGPTTWYLDPHPLQQALTNLLRNAILASPDGERAEATLAVEAGAIMIRICDHGEGSPSKTATASSSPSTPPEQEAPAWVWQWPAASSPSTAAPSRWATGRAGGPL